MNIREAVEAVAKHFVYRSDQIRIADSWRVMNVNNPPFEGDCDNFALTSIWLACDKSILKFILYVVILHKYRFWYCKTRNGNGHVVGYVQGLYFDNWTEEALPKEIFFSETGHERKFVYPSPYILMYMAIGIFFR